MTARYRFISTFRAIYGVQRMCRVLNIRRQGYYEWLDSAPARAERRRAEDDLAAEITEIHTAHKKAYGSKRVTVELHRRGRRVNRKKVERIMRERGVVGWTRRRRRSLTKQDLTAPPAPDLIGRDFTAAAPGEKFVGDITYLPTAEGWLYLATVIDLHTREVAGHAMATHMRTDLVSAAIDLAVRRGLTRPDAIFHSDRGSQGGFNWPSQHLDREMVRWAIRSGKRMFGSTGVRFRHRDGRRWPGVRIGSGSGRRSLEARRLRTPVSRRACRGRSGSGGSATLAV
jgi:transposase InsO family protein